MKANDSVRWHGIETAEALQLLESDLERGLSEAEAEARLAKFGPNEITRHGRTPEWKRFLLQFHQPLVYILVIASAIAAGLGEWVDSTVIFVVVLINAIIGWLQESKAEKALTALSRMVVTEVTVRRDGRRGRIPSRELVPGDIVLLQSGDRVPADLRLTSVRGFQVDESALTGESVPVHKHSDPLALDAILADRRNLAFAATLVTAGRGEGVVWATGDKTEAGRIAWLISEAADPPTPLMRKIAEFSRLMLWLILALAVVAFAVGLWHGEKPVTMYLAAVALAVGAIPEGLPAAVTIVLAIGVSRMAARRAIIRNLPAVETLGSTTVVCSDKTGTLTENEMTVQEIFAGGLFFDVTGSGYEPRGELQIDGHIARIAEHNALAECLKAGVLCNDSWLVEKESRWIVEGDPTEAALIVAARKAGLAEADIHIAHPRLDSIPFESEHQFMATLHHRVGGRMIYKKGAAEQLIERCSNALDSTGTAVPLDKGQAHEAVDRMAARGMRVLAFASREVALDHHRLEHGHVATDLTFLGLQGMIDPPRPEAIRAVARCRSAGIRVKMITGDHLITARAIARQIGLEDERESLAVSGREFERHEGEALADLVEGTAVFARFAPEQKLRLVQALQSRGHIVAMTGDGVNDAPALKQADIGVAMGRGGTDVAKNAADMVLTDDNFATIEAAVEEGRGVFDNLTKFIVWTLPTNGGEALTLLAAIFLGTTLPILPVQLLWINMGAAALLGTTLAFEPKEQGLMHRPPRDPGQPLLDFPLFMRTGLVTFLVLAGAYGLFSWEIERGAPIDEARTVVVNVIVFVEIFYLLNCRSLIHSIRSIGLFSNRWLWAGIAAMGAAQLGFTYLPFMNAAFHSAPLDADAWVRILTVAVAVWLIVGIEKWIRARSDVERSAELASHPETMATSHRSQ
ncbi:MAG TPA: cation-transporting P-type ATPase [Chthoniobacterales bacterium]